jgi:hypothetical protein
VRISLNLNIRGDENHVFIGFWKKSDFFAEMKNPPGARSRIGDAQGFQSPLPRNSIATAGTSVGPGQFFWVTIMPGTTTQERGN